MNEDTSSQHIGPHQITTTTWSCRGCRFFHSFNDSCRHPVHGETRVVEACLWPGGFEELCPVLNPRPKHVLEERLLKIRRSIFEVKQIMDSLNYDIMEYDACQISTISPKLIAQKREVVEGKKPLLDNLLYCESFLIEALQRE
jgi:hypothetical protein